MYDIIDPDGTQWERRAKAAERTVDVLKRKVRGLYNGEGSGAVAQQIERMRERQKAAAERRKLMEARSEALQRHAERLEEEVAERTRSLRNILDNVTFGFLIVDADLHIQPGFTRSCRELFGRELEAGQTLDEALGLDPIRGCMLEMGVGQVFDDLMPEEVSLAQIPERHELGERTLKLEGSALRSDDGSVFGVLLTISDITSLEAARAESRRNAMLVNILRQRPAFESFVGDTHATLEQAVADLDDQDAVRRAVHTVKGNAASFQLDHVTHVCHDVESEPVIDVSGIERVHVAMRVALDSFREVADIPYGDETRKTVQVRSTDLDHLVEATIRDGDMDAARAAVQAMVMRPAGELIGPVRSFTLRLAERLDKRITFHHEGIDTPVDPDRMRPVLRNISHLIRNAVDHGVESEFERGDKPETGRIAVCIAHEAGHYRVAVSDDGRGIDADRLVEKAISLGVLTPEQAADLSGDDKLQLIFHSGLSLADQTTDISGRGVGMPAVHAAVNKVGGRIDIETAMNQGTTITLWIPADDVAVAAK